MAETLDVTEFFRPEHFVPQLRAKSKDGALKEIDLAWELRHLAPSATPNRLIVEHADRLLKRDGRMISAAKAIGRGVEAWEGDVFQWDIRR